MRKTHLLKGLLTGLLALALVICAFGTFSAKAEDAKPAKPTGTPSAVSYNPNTDSLTASADCVIYYVKKATGNAIKTSTANFELKNAESITLTELGAKATNKDAYFIVVNKAYELDCKDEKANFTVKAQPAKKITGKIDYTKADNAAATDVLSFSAIDANKKAITVTPAQLIWSDDGFETVKANTLFTGAYLASKLEAGAAIEIKMLGTASPATRTSKAVKVKIAKQAKAPTVKLDVKKTTLAIKNGMDFAACTKTTGDDPVYTATTWYTVRPFFKNATEAGLIVKTADYTPVSNKDAAAKTTYTKTKIKELTLQAIMDEMNKDIQDDAKKYALGKDFDLMVRVSATEKKPASAATGITIKAQAGAPIIYTKDLVDGEKEIVTSEDGKFKAAEIANYPGTKKDGSNDVPATTGFGEAFKIDETAGNKDADDAAAKYEMCVVKSADLATIDWTTVSWKGIKKGTSITVGKTKTKYTAGTKPIEATLKAGASNVSEADSETLLLIRRAGVKGKTAGDCTQASAYLKTWVIKDGKKYIWKTEKSVGDKAYKYTIKFQRYNGTAWADDAKAETINGYGELGKDTVVTLEAPDDDTFKSFALVEGTPASLAGKTLTVTKLDDVGTQTVVVKIVQKANIKIYETVSDDENTKDKDVTPSDLDAEVGTAKEITIETKPTYSVSVKVNGETKTITENKITVTATDTKEIKISITYTKEEASGGGEEAPSD